MKTRRFSKWAFAALLCAAMLLLGSCGSEAAGNTDAAFAKLSSAQFDLPEEGEQVAVFHTEYGSFVVRFFPEYAPDAVQSFIGFAKSGYFDGQKFYRVIKDFMILSGDEEDNNVGYWGEPIPLETTPELHHFRGALSLYHDETTESGGSEFFIVTGNKVSDAMLSQIRAMGEEQYPADCVKDYERLGGYPELDYSYTVFGQVLCGIGVVDLISTVEVKENPEYFAEYSVPLVDLVIERVEITEFSKELLEGSNRK